MASYRLAAVPVALILGVVLLATGPASAAIVDPRGLASPPPAQLVAPRSGPVSLPVAPPRASSVDENVSLLPFGAQYRVTNNESNQNEVSIALNPRDARNIVVSANDYRPGYLWCGVYTSIDGGRTWLNQLVPRNGSLSLASFSGDPSVAFDADGNAYIACLGVGDVVNPVTVTKSTDGGITWGAPRQLADIETNVFHDKPYMTLDTSTGAMRGYIYVTWTRFLYDSTGNVIESPIYFSRSTDGGMTWTAGRDITGPGYKRAQGSQPSVGPAGELYVSWASRLPNGSRVVAVTKSMDGGITWGPTWVVDTLWDPGELYGGRPRTRHFPSIAVNPIDAPGGNRVHVVWADARFGSADILISTSADGGLSWGAPERVNDDATANAQFFPWVAASANGKVFVAFYDRRDDPGDRLLTVYVAVSTDLGASFGRNLLASAQFAPGTFIGDYIGLAASGDTAYPVWCDLRNGGNEEVYIAGLPMMGRDVGRAMNP